MTQISLDGLLQLFTAVILFGSMFVPIKKYNAGDGFFAQWIMSIAILLVGFCVFAYQSFTTFYPIAMLGGVFWCLGNMMAIPIIKRLGMALGILIWNSTNCMFGWAIGTFGGFGIQGRPASIPWLSYAGLILIFIGGIMFAFVKNKPTPKPSNDKKATYQLYKLSDGDNTEKIPIDDKELAILPMNPETTTSSLSEETDINLNNSSKIFGIIMALISGALYGINLAPVIYIQDNENIFFDAPKDGLPYAFSHFFGAFITSTIGFVIYAIVKKNRPFINPEIPIPALLAGLIWAIAMCCLLSATSKLSASISYPISAMLPGCIAACWSIIYFKEIEGGKNLILMIVAILVTVSGAICIGASK
jgi:glucose uptake protein GlcU